MAEAPKDSGHHDEADEIQRIRPPSSNTNEREATELPPYGPGQEDLLDVTRTASTAGTSQQSNAHTTALGRAWSNHVAIIVSHDDCRDHFALERTYLAYLRTSLAVSMLGVLIAQLFRLQHSPTPSSKIGFHVVGKPLACICNGVAMVIVVVGAWRFWRQQTAMARGKIFAGGKEIVLIGVAFLFLIVGLFALLVALDVEKEL